MLLDLDDKTGGALWPCGRVRKRRMTNVIRRWSDQLIETHGLKGAQQRIEYRLSRVRGDHTESLASLRWAVMCGIYLRLQDTEAQANQFNQMLKEAQQQSVSSSRTESA